jgi:hypothetical protein
MFQFKSNKLFIKKSLCSQDGIALMLVLGVISILTFLLADFTFETKLNKIKIYNQQDKIQARLNAESGLHFALSKLRLYQEGRNKIEKDETLKNAFPSSDLESIILQPFMYPLPLPKNANIIQKTALDEFTKKTFFRGELSLTFTKVSGFLNPNGLRILPAKKTANSELDEALKKADEDTTTESSDSKSQEKPKGEKADIIIEKKLIETLTRLIKDKSDTDENFHEKYANIDPQYLVKELKFFVNDADKFQDNFKPEIEAKFSEKNITPKHSPLASIEELYLLPSWGDEIVNLIKDRLSVHDVSVISINEITTDDLKILFPAINSIQIEEFFKYRDGDEDKKIKGKKFKNAEDFKNVIISTLNIVNDSEYNERITELKQAGLVVDTSGKLYKVNSRGAYNNAVYNIVAYVDLPIKPVPAKKKNPNEPPPTTTPDDQKSDDQKADDKKEDKPEPVELLLPRIIEIRLE